MNSGSKQRFPVERLSLSEPPLRWVENGDYGMVDEVRAHVNSGRPDQGVEFFMRRGPVEDEDISFLKSLPEWEAMVTLTPVCIREWEALLDAGLAVDRYRDLPIPNATPAGQLKFRPPVDGHRPAGGHATRCPDRGARRLRPRGECGRPETGGQ